MKLILGAANLGSSYGPGGKKKIAFSKKELEKISIIANKKKKLILSIHPLIIKILI